MSAWSAPIRWGVISDARSHWRRRRWRAIAVVLIAISAALVAYAAVGSAGHVSVGFGSARLLPARLACNTPTVQTANERAHDRAKEHSALIGPRYTLLPCFTPRAAKK
jgi:hypothetical protein